MASIDAEGPQSEKHSKIAYIREQMKAVHSVSTHKITHKTTWWKSGGTVLGCTMSLIIAGAPLRNSRAESLGPSSDHTTTPDLRVWEVKSITFAMESLASKASEVRSGWRGSTTCSLSCTHTLIVGPHQPKIAICLAQCVVFACPALFWGPLLTTPSNSFWMC